MMRKALLLSLLFVSTFTPCVGCFASTPAPPTIPRDEASALRILTDNGTSLCSGTAVAPNVILSAYHCFDTTGPYIAVNGAIAKIQRIVKDDNDHALVIVDITFDVVAKFGPEQKKSEDMHYWGNPGRNMFYRRGYVTGMDENATYYDVNGYAGDSGAGVFDSKGRLVGVISFYTTVMPLFMGSFPINFTEEQLQFVGIPADPVSDKILKSGRNVMARMGP